MKQQLLLSSILALLTITLIRCNEDPNPVGAGLLPASDFIQLDTLSATATGSYSQASIPLGLASRILIGKTPEIESWAVLAFNPVPDSILFLPMVSAEVKLRTVYHFGDSLAPFSVDVHKVLQGWGTDSLTIDSVKAQTILEEHEVIGAEDPSENRVFFDAARILLHRAGNRLSAFDAQRAEEEAAAGGRADESELSRVDSV